MGESRFLSAFPALVVEDVRAAVRFYRDVLGFRAADEYSAADDFAIAELGPGQGVHFKRGRPVRAWRRTTGVYVWLPRSALDQVAARLHAHDANVVAPLADQPWGTRELSVLDPDGHLVRLGTDLTETPSATTARLTPEIPTSDAVQAATYCRDRLGMGPPEPAPEAPYFQRSHRDAVGFHWWSPRPSPFAASLLAPWNRSRAGIWDVYVETQGLDALAAELTARAVSIYRGPTTTPYSVRELEIAGPDGCTICFGERQKRNTSGAES